VSRSLGARTADECFAFRPGPPPEKDPWAIRSDQQTSRRKHRREGRDPRESAAGPFVLQNRLTEVK